MALTAAVCLHFEFTFPYTVGFTSYSSSNENRTRIRKPFEVAGSSVDSIFTQGDFIKKTKSRE